MAIQKYSYHANELHLEYKWDGWQNFQLWRQVTYVREFINKKYDFIQHAVQHPTYNQFLRADAIKFLED